MKIAYIIIMAVLFLGYNIFFNKKSGGGLHGGYSWDPMPLIKGMISFMVYLISWIVWFIIF